MLLICYEPEHRVGKGVFLVGHPIHLRVDVGLDSPEVATRSLPQPRSGTSGSMV